jgi:hypothetical protein
MKLDELENFPELGNTIVIDGIEYVKKREPLSDGTTADMWHVNKKATHPDSYWAGVYDAEKAHGIGGK